MPPVRIGRHRLILLIALLLFLPAAVGCGGSEPVSETRESVLDRVVALREIRYEVPAIPRWCDRIETLEKHRVNVGDCELYVETEGRGTPLVLVNGGPGGTHHCFHPWFSLAAEFVQVIYYDQRGCGLSDRTPGPEGYSVQQAAADLEAIRQALGHETWTVLGYSYGGFLAQWYAISHPESVSGLVLLGAAPGLWTEMEPTRQYDYISTEEREHLNGIRSELQTHYREQGWSHEHYLQLLLYNNHLNADWKRQNFYRPSTERCAEIALYEWDHADEFRRQLIPTMDAIDLSGAFEDCPIPTLILEGEWDLTWNTDKRDLLLDNHPGAELIVFERAGHGIYDEDTDAFFTTLRRFLRRLPRVPQRRLAAWQEYLADWNQARLADPRYLIRQCNEGHAAYLELANRYRSDWLAGVLGSSELRIVGHALYDATRYDDALEVFRILEETARDRDDETYLAIALIWQGHMLDLLDRRSEAVAVYEQVRDMDLGEDGMRHDQFGLAIVFDSWVAERIESPFTRVENRWP